jgi:hypothetical protein
MGKDGRVYKGTPGGIENVRNSTIGIMDSDNHGYENMIGG